MEDKYIATEIKLMALKDEAGDPKEADGFETVKEMLSGTAKMLFEENGTVYPTAIFLFSKDNENLIGIFPLNEYFELGESGRDRAAEVAAKMAQALGAYCTLFASEATTHTQPKEDKTEWVGMDNIPDSDKEDAVVLTYEHSYLGSGILRAKIIGSGDNRSIGNFEELGGDHDKGLSGRFSRLIHSRNLEVN